GAATGRATTTAALTPGLPGATFSGAATATATATASLSLGSLLSGAATASATGMGALPVGRRLSGARTGTATLTGALTALPPGILFDGACRGIATVRGSLTLKGVGDLGPTLPTHTERPPAVGTTVPSVHRHKTLETGRRHTEGPGPRTTTRHPARRTVEVGSWGGSG